MSCGHAMVISNRHVHKICHFNADGNEIRNCKKDVNRRQVQQMQMKSLIPCELKT